MPKAYALNVTKIETILNEKTFLPKKTVPYIMDTNINIDSEEDFRSDGSKEKSESVG